MKYSIITINYNNCDGLRKTIESVISQSYKDYEFIIIDGGSTDGSREIIEQHSSSIDYWVSEPDKGIYNAMNKGIRQARGAYINFMNSGDAFYGNETSQKVNDQIDGSDFIIGKDYHVDPETGEDFVTILPLRISMAMFFMSTLPHQSSFIKRSLFNNSLYDENLRITSDWKFFMEKIVFEGCSFKLLDTIVSIREQNGIGSIQLDKITEEHNLILTNILPPGIYKDYKTLSHLDRSTLYKLLNLLDQERGCNYITLAVKIIYRLLNKFPRLFQSN